MDVMPIVSQLFVKITPEITVHAVFMLLLGQRGALHQDAFR